MKENQHFIGSVQNNTFFLYKSDSTFYFHGSSKYYRGVLPLRQCLDELMIMINYQIYLYVYRMEQKPDQRKLVSQWN